MNRRRLLLLAPVGIAGAAGAAFLTMLHRMEAGKFDPREVPSQLIGKPVPPFALHGLTSADLAAGHPVLVNFFASWCVPCVEEAPVLMDLKRQGIPVIGIAYKDKPQATADFLTRHGDPYARLGADLPGSVAIDWGLYGVPETYLIDGRGVVRWRYVGPLTPDAVVAQLDPMLHRYA